jgi:L-lactate dehydrogenase (cytochrome)
MVRQNVLRDVEGLSTATTLFGEDMALPVVLAPVGLTGMYARRGEVQAARAAAAAGVPFTLSTVSVCPLEEVQAPCPRPIWFQLYVLKDRGFMRNVLERAKAAGIKTLVFTVDMPLPGSRYRDAHSGMSGPNAAFRRMVQAATHPAGHGTWACAAARTIWAISRTTWASRWRWATTSAGWAPISIRRSAGRIWNGSARSGTGR